MTDTHSPDNNAFFDADRPIEELGQDRLGRSSFAKSVARQLLAVPVGHGFTVAVTGEWGLR